MTTIADFLASIRQSLASIEQSTDTGQQPKPPQDYDFRELDCIADTLARSYRRAGQKILEMK